MKRKRVEKVWAEMHRLIDRIKEFDSAEKALDPTYHGKPGECYRHLPKESGAVRRASLDLTRALAEMRKSDYA